MSRSWLFRYNHNQRPTWMGLGSARDINLADARQQAAEYRRLLAHGKDPIVERDGERARTLVEKQRSMSFDQCSQSYIAAHRDGRRNSKHAAQWENTLRLHASPVIGKLPVDQVELRHVLLILEPIWRDRTETASRVRGRVESILDWATVRQFRRGENPARWRGHLNQLLPMPGKVNKVEHHAALPFIGMLDFMEKLARQEGTGARALSFLILTAARSGEVRGATRGEIDLETRVWSIPGARMKAGRDHRGRCPTRPGNYCPILCREKRPRWRAATSSTPLPSSIKALKAWNSSAGCNASRPLFSATLTSSARSGGTSSHSTSCALGEQGDHADAALNLARAEQAQRAWRERLNRLLGVWGAQPQFTLPARLPDLPATSRDLPDIERLALARRLDVQGAMLAADQTAKNLGLTRRMQIASVDASIEALRDSGSRRPTSTWP